MLAMVPSQTWNYTTNYNNQPITLTLYADPNLVNGVRALVGAAVTGIVPTVATSTTSMQTNIVGAIGFTVAPPGNYDAVSELSKGGLAAIPGSPLFVSSTLTQGQTWIPYSGVTATVIQVGSAIPNVSACPKPGIGAEVEYRYTGYDDTLSFVPGCGITDVHNNLSGADFALVSTSNVPAIGQLARARQTDAATLLDTAASLLGRNREAFKAASFLQFFR